MGSGGDRLWSVDAELVVVASGAHRRERAVALEVVGVADGAMYLAATAAPATKGSSPQPAT